MEFPTSEEPQSETMHLDSTLSMNYQKDEATISNPKSKNDSTLPHWQVIVLMINTYWSFAETSLARELNNF